MVYEAVDVDANIIFGALIDDSIVDGQVVTHPVNGGIIYTCSSQYLNQPTLLLNRIVLNSSTSQLFRVVVVVVAVIMPLLCITVIRCPSRC